MTVLAGTRLGPYEVVAPVGAGGMGEVWRATDTRLDRSVAIKILPDGFAQNEQFRARFEREAKTISSLNHPHICSLFDVGYENGHHFLVMELLEGETLAERISRGPLPLDQVLKFGAQIAEALDRAHKQGVVHRDLKPANVMITRSGAKLLDFGLARSAAEASPVRGLTDMPTQAKALTEEGTILGTFQYMAPEQLEGLEADARTDIFSFGALLYEMATGRRAFEGASRTSLIAAIVASQPAPISTVAPMTPPALDHVVRKCLEKDPDDRWQSAHDVASELRWISEGASQTGLTTSAGRRHRTRERVAWTLAALAAALAIGATALLLTRREPPRKPVESAIVLPAGWRPLLNGGIEISPDGENVAFVLTDDRGGGTSLWMRPLGSAAFHRLHGTDGALRPFWSPDSRKIGFFAGGKLKIYNTQGGAVHVVCDARGGGGASWSSAGTILVGRGADGGLATVRATGGTLMPLTKLRDGDITHVSPFVLPDGKTFLFLAINKTTEKTAICQASLDRPSEIKAVLTVSSPVVWVQPGVVLYNREGRLIAQRYDAARAETIGDPVTIADLFAAFSASNDGKLILQRNPNLVLSQLVWVDRSGKEERIVGPPGLYFSPSISRDQRRFAVDLSSATTGNGDIWIHDIARNSATRVTYEEENESAPRWSPGDKTIVYYASINDRASGDVFEVAAGGTGTPRTLVSDAREKRPTHVSSDGQWVLFNTLGGGNMDIGVWSPAGKGHRMWLSTPFREQGAQLSPDGKWIAYQSDETGRWEIYVRAFPESDRKWLISNDGGTMPVWRADGRELYYVSLDGKMTAVAVTPGNELEAAAPVALFDAPLRQHPTTQYDVTNDGRFLLNRRVESAVPDPIALLQNWDVQLLEK